MAAAGLGADRLDVGAGGDAAFGSIALGIGDGVGQAGGDLFECFGHLVLVTTAIAAPVATFQIPPPLSYTRPICDTPAPPPHRRQFARAGQNPRNFTWRSAALWL